MERTDIVDTLSGIFKTVFTDDSITLTDELSANEVERWDSLSHMILISEIEKSFSIKFKLKELNKMRNVGDMVNIIISKN